MARSKHGRHSGFGFCIYALGVAGRHRLSGAIGQPARRWDRRWLSGVIGQLARMWDWRWEKTVGHGLLLFVCVFCFIFIFLTDLLSFVSWLSFDQGLWLIVSGWIHHGREVESGFHHHLLLTGGGLYWICPLPLRHCLLLLSASCGESDGWQVRSVSTTTGCESAARQRHGGWTTMGGNGP